MRPTSSEESQQPKSTNEQVEEKFQKEGSLGAQSPALEDIPKLAVRQDNLNSSDHSTQDEDFEENDRDRDIPLRYRLIAFSMIIFFATGSSFCEATLSPLKSTLVKQLKINSVGMDYWGATYAAIISSIFIFVGALVASASANVTQYQLLIGGRILMGFGSTIIESTQNKLYAHWFAGSHLAFVFAIDIAWGRIVTIVAKATAVPMSQINGWWGWALWIPMITTGFNLVLVLVYWLYERNVPRQYRPRLGKAARSKEGWDRRKFIFRSLFTLPKFFWILCGTQIFQNAAVSVYTSNLADIQTRTRGTSTLAAGYNSSLQGLIPIFLTPAVGYFFDRFGFRMIFVSGTAVLYVVVFILIGLTTVHPLAPILLSSFVLCSDALTFIASIPVLVGDDALLGTAFGVWRSFQNVNTTILEVAAGAIQDRSGGSYNNVIYLLIAIKSVEVLWGPVYDWLDGRWLGHSLRLPEKKRLEVRREARNIPGDLPGWRVSKRVMGVVMVQLSCMIVVAWVVYIIYSLGT